MQFRNILEELEVIRFRKDIEREMESYFEDKGFSIIEPRMLQRYDDFISSNYRQNSSKTVKVLSGDSSIYILRPDITTNILSQIFSKWEGNPSLKVYYNSKIYQNTNGGQVLEKYQMGVESLGSDVSSTDEEIVEMATFLMGTLGEPYILELGSSKYLDSFFKQINLNFDDEIEIKNLIGKKNRSDLEVKLKSVELENTILNRVLDMQGNMKAVIDLARSYEMNKEMEEALNSLEKLNEFLITKNIADKIKLDLSMIPDLDYYDGIVFRGYCLGVPTKILSGGRYDKSTERFGLRVPAIGFMIDMDLVTRVRIKGGK